MNRHDIEAALRAHASAEKAAGLQWFFKTGPGQYGEGDTFLGITMPQIRATIKSFYTMPLSELTQLLHSPWHEDRMAALLIMVWQFKRTDDAGRTEIYHTYLANTAYINNWDLIDLSAEHIVGPYLDRRADKIRVLGTLARSQSLWERRIAMLATFHYIRAGRSSEALAVIDILLHDSEDLIRKATGWMLREIGKRVDRQLLLDYLEEHAHNMPRTTLRYAIEHLSPEQKQHYMALKNTK